MSRVPDSFIIIPKRTDTFTHRRDWKSLMILEDERCATSCGLTTGWTYANLFMAYKTTIYSNTYPVFQTRTAYCCSEDVPVPTHGAAIIVLAAYVTTLRAQILYHVEVVYIKFLFHTSSFTYKLIMNM